MLQNILTKIDSIENNMDQSIFRCSQSQTRTSIARVGQTIEEMESSGYNILSSNKSINDSKSKTKSSSLLSARPNLPLAKRNNFDEEYCLSNGNTKEKEIKARGCKEGNNFNNKNKNLTFSNFNNNTLEFSLGSTPNNKH